MTEPEWKPGRWWRVVFPGGAVWLEGSDGDEAREALDAARDEVPGATLQRLWVRAEDEWRDEA